MKDFATSSDPKVQAQLDRLAALTVPDGRLGLDTIRALLARLGDPHTRLPPVFHVAGTNGKGSTCAFLRAMLEADGKRVHVTTSPHLVRYNERIRIAGELISDEALAVLLAEVLDAGEYLGASFFEVTIAAAFLAFSRTRADACIVEVGLGGRLDATNVLEPDAVAVSGIAALGIDHERFLLAPEDGVPDDPMARIAFEKAGIAKAGVPLVNLGLLYSRASRAAIAEQATRAAAKQLGYGLDWHFNPQAFNDDGLEWIGGASDMSNSSLLGKHQAFNAGLAVAMLHYQTRLNVGRDAIELGLKKAQWPARMQRLADGPLTFLASDRTVWLDGGHNPSAGEAIAKFLESDIHLILGMLANKDPRALIEPLGDRIRSLTSVPVPGQDSHPASAFGSDALAAADVEEALLSLPDDDYPVLIAGSLYLAGEVLRLNDEIPD